jgi:uncharacterized protein YegL
MSSDLSETILGGQTGGSSIPDVQPPDTPSRKRRVVVILADVSYSMASQTDSGLTRIEALNQQLTEWVPRVRSDSRLGDVEFAVVTFGDAGVQVVSRDRDVPDHADGGAFVPAAEFQLGPLSASGVTPMAAAIERAITLAQDRGRYLKQTHGVISGQPRLIMFTDGQPTDDQGNPTDAWRAVAGRLQAFRTQRRLQFFGFGVPGVNTAVMRELVPDPDGYRELESMDFKMLLDLILLATSAADPFDTLRKANPA